MDEKSAEVSSPRSTGAVATGSTRTTTNLRDFSETHISKDLSNISERRFENALLHGCTFKKLNGVTMERCVLDRARFLTTDPADAQDFTLTLNCHSFRDAEYSEELLDLMLTLLTLTKGNDAKRRALVSVIGKETYLAILRRLTSLET
jgi:hypothetical protein